MSALDQQYEAEISLAEGAFASQNSGAMISVAGDLQGFLASHRSELSGPQVDQLEAGISRLTGNGPGTPQAQQSAFFAGLQSFGHSLADDVNAARQKAGELLSSDNIKILAIVAGIFLAYKILKG